MNKLKELAGQHLALPAGHADWEEKLRWFQCGCFLEAHIVAHFKPAIEWKGRPPTQEIVDEFNGRNIYWGIHAPNNFADQVYDDRSKFVSWMEQVVPLQPNYIVVHGGGDYLISDVPYDDPIERFRSPIDHISYLAAICRQFEILAEMVRLMSDNGEILLENTSVTEFVGCEQLPTYCHPRVGNWIEVATIAERAGAKPLCDVGHLAYGYNFYARLEDYIDLPPVNNYTPVFEAQKVLWDEFGLGIQYGELPVTRHLLDLPDAIAAIGASHYHVEAGFREEIDGKIGTHAPIELNDQRIRGIIAQIIQQENCLMCLEVDGSRADGSGPFPDRAPTEVLQAESWRNLCTIATELTR